MKGPLTSDWGRIVAAVADLEDSLERLLLVRDLSDDEHAVLRRVAQTLIAAKRKPPRPAPRDDSEWLKLLVSSK